MANDDLPLFAWRPQVSIVIAFPLSRRVSKIQDVARKLITKRSDAHVEQYTSQVSNALRRQLIEIGASEDQQDAQLSAFWSKVDQEAARLTWCASSGSNNPRGAA